MGIVDILKNKITSKEYNENILYLIHNYSENIGYFYFGKKILFLVKSTNPSNFNKDTEYLSVRSHVYIRIVESDVKFEETYYDFIVFNEEINHHYFETFISLCDSYYKNFGNISFADFCNKMFKLFEPSKEQSERNHVGLFGELYLILDLYFKKNILIHENWHINGPHSKYDFSFNNINLEVKTILKSNQNIIVKHEQLFNDDKIILAVMKIEENPSGKTLNEIIYKLQTIEPFASDFEFQAKLAKEILRISKNKLENIKMDVVLKTFYDRDDFITFDTIPPYISKLYYEYSLIEQKSMEIEKLITLLK